MKKLKVMTVVGTRPEIIRLSCVIRKLEESEAIEHLLVHTGQNYDYELNEVFFQDFGLRKPDFFLDAVGAGPMETIGTILASIDRVLEDTSPDAFLVLGDTNSCLAAIAAKRRHIPIFHMEAGNRCYDQRVPEETNRRIVDHISDINMTYSDIAREYLLREGLSADRIIKTGSPMLEVFLSREKEIEQSNILSKLGLDQGEYFVVSLHREENVDDMQNLMDITDSLNQIARIYQKPIIVSTHPRTGKKIEENHIQFNEKIRLLKPMGFVDYVKLQKESFAVLSDSGTISEEASIVGFKALNIRQAHERPEAMEEAVVMMVGSKAERILQGLSILSLQNEQTLRKVADYGMENVSDKVLRIILSYTDYVNRVVWGRR